MLSKAWSGRTASATDLWRSVSHSRRRWQRRHFCHHCKFDVYATNGVIRLCQVVYRSMRRRSCSHGQSNWVAERCAVLQRFIEHWRRWHSSDLRQRWTARSTTFVSSDVRRRHFSGGTFVILSALRSSSSTPITRFRWLAPPWPEKLHCIKASSKSCMP